jgi:hypothetical protein
MATVRAHIVLPAKLAEEIDALVGPRGRSAFLVETAEAEVKRRKLKAFLQRKEPAWKDEDHPEIASTGAAAWVRKQRDEKSERQLHLEEKLETTRD